MDENQVSSTEETADGSPSPRELLQRFELGAHLYATRTSEGYQAADPQTGERALIWFLRHPLDVSSDGPRKFVSRLQAVQQNGLLIPPFKFCGVDAAGKAFLGTDYVDGKPVALAQLSISEAQRVFLEIVQAVAALHQQGLCCGDISQDSFVLGPHGEVRFVAVLGSFDSEARQTAMLPPPHTLQYLSPEQRSGFPITPAADVYALGVLGYRLFTGRDLFGEKTAITTDDPAAVAPAPTLVKNELPAWTDDVLGRCLERQAELRYPDAHQLELAVDQCVRFNISPGGTGRWSRRTMIVRPNTVGTMRPAAAPSMALGPAVKAETAASRKHFNEDGDEKRKGLPILIGGLIVGIIAAVLFLVAFDRPNRVQAGSFEDEISKHEENAPAELRRPLHDLMTADMPVEKRREALEEIARSSDAIAYMVLISAAKLATSGELRAAAQELVVKRVRDHGFTNSADVLGKWFVGQEGGARPAPRSPAFADLLAACDPSLPIETRRYDLHRAFAQDPQIAVQLAAALSLDAKDPEQFVPVLRQLLGAQSGRQDLGDKSLGALILSNRNLLQQFDSQAKTMLPRLSTPDLAWVLLQLADTDSQALYDAVNETLSRKVVPPFQEVFLQVLASADHFGTPGPVKKTLVKCARGEFSEYDINVLGRWQALGAEPVLLSICAIANDPGTALAAFDTLSVRSLVSQPASSLVEWVKNKYWERRAELIKAIGILGHSNIAGPEQLDYAFTKLMPFARSILSVMINANDPRLIKMTLQRMGEVATSDELLPLLSHQDKEVRIAAIDGLRGRNELTVLQAIVRAHAKEKDPQVREYYYTAKHWVACDR